MKHIYHINAWFPWKINKNGKTYITLNDSMDGYLIHAKEIVKLLNSIENARLIATAPEMLAALEEALKCLEFAKERDPDMRGAYHCPQARNAIKKAKGE